MKPTISSASINGQSSGAAIRSGSNGFQLNGSFPTDLGSSDVTFTPLNGTVSMVAISGNTASQVSGTFSYSGGQGGQGDLGIIAKDPAGESSDLFALHVTYPSSL